jgi:hypothetical protein
VKLSGDAIKGCTAEIKKPDPDSEAFDRRRLRELGAEIAVRPAS